MRSNKLSDAPAPWGRGRLDNAHRSVILLTQVAPNSVHVLVPFLIPITTIVQRDCNDPCKRCSGTSATCRASAQCDEAHHTNNL